MTHHIQFPILSKSYPEVGINGLSNILIPYPQMINGTTNEADMNTYGLSYLKAFKEYINVASVPFIWQSLCILAFLYRLNDSVNLMIRYSLTIIAVHKRNTLT